ncbi:STAS domain-containing protein [Streptomyces sp. Edi4]|uniref:STAS domain-containing protein n=1 Tax=Streptomyces sp. Edi4 TaxID=3162527 RepID=UPI003305699D
MSALTITIREVSAGPVLAIAGDLDYDTAAQLRDELARTVLAPGRRLVLDLAGLTFCDSSGIAAFIAARNHAHAARADIALATVPDHTLRILRVVGLDQVFAFQRDASADPAPPPGGPCAATGA